MSASQLRFTRSNIEYKSQIKKHNVSNFQSINTSKHLKYEKKKKTKEEKLRIEQQFSRHISLIPKQ